jgi:hypothetical protein
MPFQAESGFRGLKGVGNEATDQIHEKIDGAAMTRMVDWGNIFSLIDDGFNDGSFAKEHFVTEIHQIVGHLLS